MLLHMFLTFMIMWQLCVRYVFRLLWPEQSRSDMLFEQRASGAFHDRGLPGGCETVGNFIFIMVVFIFLDRSAQMKTDKMVS